MGWIRAAQYTKHRVVRLSDASWRIAAGLAIGTSVSFTPLVGTHFIQAGLVAYLSRVNLIASLIGTFAGNPWTFPFMWWASIILGSFFFGFIGLPAETALPDKVTFSIMWDLMLNEPLRIFIPWLVGSYLLALVTWPLWFVVYFYLVMVAKKAREHSKVIKERKNAAEITGQAE